MLDNICHCYAAGERDAREPKYFTHVQWREFALDVNRIQPQPFLEGLQGDVVTYPQVGQCGDPQDTDASRVHPVYGTTPTCCTAKFGTMPSTAMAGGGNAKPQGAKVSMAAQPPSGGAAAVSAGGAAAQAGFAQQHGLVAPMAAPPSMPSWLRSGRRGTRSATSRRPNNREALAAGEERLWRGGPYRMCDG